jgi:hypothetical protein
MTFSRSDCNFFFFFRCLNKGVKLLWTSERQAVASTLHAMEHADLVDWTKLKTSHFDERRVKVELAR